MKILKKDKSKLIDRTKLLIEYPHIQKPSPSNNDIKKEIAKELKAKEELVVVKNINTKFGEGNSLIKAYIYDNLEELKKLEKVEEQKKEEPKEAPKEEPKEKIKEDGKETETKEQAAE